MADREPIELDAGSHTLRVGRDVPIRRMWLSATESGVRSTTAARTWARTVRRGRADFEVKVISPTPAYVITGASSDPGWSATRDGQDAGAQVSLDGQAAWRVPTGTHTLVGTRDDQGLYVLALAVSGLGVLTCSILVARGRFR